MFLAMTPLILIAFIVAAEVNCIARWLVLVPMLLLLHVVPSLLIVSRGAPDKINLACNHSNIIDLCHVP
jgi:hypothetical protein